MDNHDTAPGVRLKFAKKGAGVTTVNYAQAVESALCYGWIDGQVGRFDERYYLQQFTPRRTRSKWSEINREKAERLIAEGRMREPGLGQIDAARADGRWDDAYPPQSRATVPDDFQRSLDRHPAASEFFQSLSGSTRYAFLYRLHHVKEPLARKQRIADYLELLKEGKTLG